MNPSVFPAPAATALRRSRPARAGGFALVVTLLIISLLAIVAVSFLTSMSSERQTANAYLSKTRAEQAAQAGVDAAEAILSESFRDFPDSCTVWDTKQTYNTGTPNGQESATTVAGATNEGTSLYLRAVASGTVADPNYTGTTPAANDPKGNNPNNQACKTFVLPLISGVPGGNAQLASTIHLTTDLTEADPAKQTDPTKTYCTDLNVRRFGKSVANPYGDLQGVIGSPPGWTDNKPIGPKPARAYWINLKGNNGLVTGRYAFWIDDESFRANVDAIGNAAAAARIDDGPAATKRYPLTATTGQPYIVGPVDASLSGALQTITVNSVLESVADSATDAQRVLSTRSSYSLGLFPDFKGFSHTFDVDPAPLSAKTTALIDGLRYLSTIHSGTLNLTRHGTQRVNLNTTVTNVDLASPTAVASIQKQIDQIVQTLKFHLPNFGQRFYRTSAATDATTLNNATMVNQTATLQGEGIGDPTQIYLYKVAANLRDYLDSDCQPTLIAAGGTVVPPQAPVQPFGDSGQANPMWAIGKEAAPFLQETAVRFRPVVNKGVDSNGKTIYNFTLAVDYYLEFWNMTDHDVYVSGPSTVDRPSLNGAYINITNQQTWDGYPHNEPFTKISSPPPVTRVSDFTIDLSKGSNAAGEAVVFRAGQATVITTDPDYQTYQFATPIHSSTKYTSLTGVPNPHTTFYCPIVPPGTRTFSGTTGPDDYGIVPEFRDGTQDYQTEVTFYNQYGYFDCALFGIAEGGGPVSTYTATATGDGDYNNYSYGGSLYGNSLVSEMGDPRTNNEQMIFYRATGAAAGDLSRYYNGNHTLGYPNANYVQPVGGSFAPPGSSSTTNFIPWADYYTWPGSFTNPDQSTAPAVVADRPLVSIGQLGDLYDPARVNGSVIEVARGGGRTFKIGQRDDRVTYDPTGSPAAAVDNVPASQGWASWRLADVFSAGPVDANNPTGPVQEPIELPARLNINGATRDNGAGLRALLTGFHFQPSTVDPNLGTSEPLFHTPPAMAGTALTLQPSATNGLARIVAQMTARLQGSPALGSNIPWGPFFERGEFGELESNTAIFGKNVTSTFLKSTDLVSPNVDMNRTFDRGREELFRRLSEMICTRGDTFTVYVVGQSISQQTPRSALKVTGTHRMRVTFRLVPKLRNQATGNYGPFHPAYNAQASDDSIIVSAKNYDFNNPTQLNTRFAKPDRYDVQVLEANIF